MKLFWIPLTRIMLAYWSFNWNLWVKGSVGVYSNWACLRNGKEGMVVVRTGEEKHFQEDMKVHEKRGCDKITCLIIKKYFFRWPFHCKHQCSTT